MSLGKLTKVEVTATPEVAAELRDLFLNIGEGVPAVTGYYDKKGKLRRIVAQHSDGWRHQVNIDAKGYIKSQRSSLKMVSSRDA